MEERQRLPEFLKRGIIDCEETKKVRKLLNNLNLNTVCDEARCPNKAECYKKNSATFMIMGKFCTRNCRFCAVQTGKPEELDKNEPLNIAKAIKELNLKYAVITSVTRDDLPDFGAEHFKQTIEQTKKLNPNIKIEVLTPDFKNNDECIKMVAETPLDVFNHNIETTRTLHKTIRPQADYDRSLSVLYKAKKFNPKLKTKTGLMVGLGESIDDIKEIFKDLVKIECDIMTIGQYIQPTKNHVKVVRYYEEEEYKELEKIAKEIGIKYTFFAPLARSSYRAAEVFE